MPNSENLVRVAASLPIPLHAALVRRAGELDRSQAWILREAVRQYLGDIDARSFGE